MLSRQRISQPWWSIEFKVRFPERNGKIGNWGKMGGEDMEKSKGGDGRKWGDAGGGINGRFQ